uniref:Uncharacterized protein n=1 Tax=Anguilla anguilla TaxID=7936 RepID=A0A0E9WN40_ANGAN
MWVVPPGNTQKPVFLLPCSPLKSLKYLVLGLFLEHKHGIDNTVEVDENDSDTTEPKMFFFVFFFF